MSFSVAAIGYFPSFRIEPLETPENSLGPYFVLELSTLDIYK